MCGIAGIIGYPINEGHLRAFQTLMYLTELRGGDGIGAFSVNTSTQNKHTAKVTINSMKDSTVTPDYARWDPDYEKILSHEGTKRFIVGHCRAATKGSVKTTNNHPFETDNVIGVHNGTLTGSQWQDETKTDSELLYEAIGSRGFSEVYKEIKDEPYALAWFDKVENQLCLTRSKDRPLVLMKLSEDAILFSSNEHMLNFVAKHHNLNVARNGFLSLAPGTLVKFDLFKHTVSEPVYVGPVVPEEKKQVG